MRIASGSSIFFASLAAVSSLAAPISPNLRSESPRPSSSGRQIQAEGSLSAGKRQSYADLGRVEAPGYVDDLGLPNQVPPSNAPIEYLPSPVQSATGKTSTLPIPGLLLDALHHLTIPVKTNEPLSARDLPTTPVHPDPLNLDPVTHLPTPYSEDPPTPLSSKVPVLKGPAVPSPVVPYIGDAEDLGESLPGNNGIPIQLVDGKLLFDPPANKIKKRDWKNRLKARQSQKADPENPPWAPLATPIVPAINSPPPNSTFSAPAPTDTLYHALPIAIPLRLSIPVQDSELPMAPLPIDPGSLTGVPRDEDEDEDQESDDTGSPSAAEIAGYFYDTRWVFENLS